MTNEIESLDAIFGRLNDKVKARGGYIRSGEEIDMDITMNALEISEDQILRWGQIIQERRAREAKRPGARR